MKKIIQLYVIGISILALTHSISLGHEYDKLENTYKYYSQIIKSPTAYFFDKEEAAEILLNISKNPNINVYLQFNIADILLNMNDYRQPICLKCT